MASAPVTVPRFGGLDLKTEITELGFQGAASILNLDFTAPGAPTRRPGTERFTVRFADSAEQSPYGSIHYHLALDAFFSVYRNNSNSGSFVKLDQDGYIVDTSPNWGTPSTTSLAGARFVSFGSDTNDYVFMTAGGAGTSGDVITYDSQIADFDVAPGFTGHAPDGDYLAVTPWDNRLVSAGGTHSNTTVHRVRFSTEGDPFTWGTPTGSATDYYVDLTPGDGEEIREVVTWGDYMFVFKQTKFFVFYGVDVGAGGVPIFNYRTVHGNGIPLEWDGRAPAAAAADDGVYFVNFEGVWRTTGGPPVKVSVGVDPLFSLNDPQDPNPYFTDVPSRTEGDEYCAVTVWGDRLLIYGHADTVLEYHTREGWWSRWSLPGLSYQSHLYAIPERFTSSTTLYGFMPDLMYSATVAGTNEYYRGHIMMVSEEADQDHGGNQVWQLTATGGTSGNFTVRFHPTPSTTQTTASIAYNASTATVQTELVALAGIDQDDIFVTGLALPTGPVVIGFTSGGSYAAATSATFSIGTENVTNGNAAITQVADGAAATPIECHWMSGATDLGSDTVKIVKDVMVLADSGKVGASLAVDLEALPTFPDEHVFSTSTTVRFRGVATNAKGRQIALRLENFTDDEEASRVSWRRATLNVLGERSGPQNDATVV